jgi:drug/metabolite transporter (DMT)-like permease
LKSQEKYAILSRVIFMKKEQIKGSAMLLFATLIWGSAFVAQSVGMDHLGPMSFQAVRSLLAVAAMAVLVFCADRDKRQFFVLWKNKALWKTGILCGLALFVAQGLQQMGLQYTEPGKAGFITAMYIVLVPVFGLFLGRRCGWQIWLSVALAVAGLYLLSCVGVARINLGDVMILVSAGAFAVQILLIDYLAQELDGLRLNGIQFLVVMVLSSLAAALTETATWQGVIDCAVPLLFAGILSSGVAFSLQILGQQHLPPEPASLIMSLESVFAVLAGWVILGQTLRPIEALGCCLVFAGVILCQIKAK